MFRKEGRSKNGITGVKLYIFYVLKIDGKNVNESEELDISFQPPLMGRQEEMKTLEDFWDGVRESEGLTVFISGEAGIGKTRLVEEFLNGVQGDARIIRGECLSESLQPLMPMREALRDADLYHLVSKDPPPKVISVYLINRSGILVQRAEREVSDLDPDIFASMLDAVENFVGDSLNMMGEDQGSELNTIGYGEYDILIQSMEGMSLATVIEGMSNEFLIKDMRRTLSEVGARFDSWEGDMEEAEEVKPELDWFIDSDKYEGEYLVDEPKLKQENLFDNVLLGVQRIAQEEPVIIFLDDIQWADTNTLNLLHYLSRNTKENRVLILGTYRPEDIFQEEGEKAPLKKVKQKMGREDLFEEIRLERLKKKDMGEFLSNNFTEELSEKIYRESEGNPLFMLEIVRNLIEEGDVKRGEIGLKFDKPAEKINISSKIRDLVNRRLGRLTGEQREILEGGSVLGEEFESRILQDITGQERVKLLKELNDIEREYSLIDSLEKKYRFDHSKVREILYNSINEELREEYHRIAAESYEKHMGEEVERIAHHFYHAKDKRAGEYLIKTAERKEESYANEDAVRDYTRALEFLEEEEARIDTHVAIGDIFNRISEYSDALEHYRKAEKMEEDDVKRAKIKWKMAQALEKKGDFEKGREICHRGLELVKDEKNIERARLLTAESGFYRTEGQYEKGKKVLEKARDIAEELEEKREIGEIDHSLGTLYFQKKEYEKALKHFERALEIREEIGDELGLCKTLNNVANVHDDIGEVEKALENYKEALELSKKMGDKYDTATIQNNIGIIYWDRGELERVLDHFNDSLEMFKKIGNQRVISILENNIGNVHRNKGELDKGIEHYKRSLSTAEKLDNPLAQVNPLNGMGRVFKERGELDNAREYLEKSLRYAEEGNDKGMVLEDKLVLAEIDVMEGRLDRAMTTADEVLEVSDESGIRKMRGLVKGIKGMIFGRQERWGEASQQFEEARKELDDIGDRRESVKVLYESALMYKRKGKEKEAVERLEKAKDMFEEMGMELWVDKTEKALDPLLKE